MDILLITEFLPTKKNNLILGGVQARTFFIRKHLIKRHSINKISFDTGKIDASVESLLPRLRFAFSIVFAKLKKKPDLIEASNVTTFIPAFFLAKRLGVPAVAWVPDILGKSWMKYFSLPVALIGRSLEKIGIKLPWTQIIAMSKSTRDKLIYSGVKPDKISVVYGGVEFEKLNKLRVKKYKNPTICSIARLLPYKRIEDLIEAISLIKKKHPAIRCFIIGEGSEKNKLKSKITRLKLSSEIKLLGNMPHLKAMKILKSSHLFCLPSVVEGFGIVTVEAMAAGVPYVNSQIKPTIEITQNGKGGLLFNPKDPRDLADSIDRLLGDKKLYAKKQEEGKKLAKLFDWSIIAEQTEHVYKKATNTSPSKNEKFKIKN